MSLGDALAALDGPGSLDPYRGGDCWEPEDHTWEARDGVLNSIGNPAPVRSCVECGSCEVLDGDDWEPPYEHEWPAVRAEFGIPDPN